MGWVASPVIPGLDIPPSLTWEGEIPAEGVPAPPPTTAWGDILAGIPYVAPVIPAAAGIPAAVAGAAAPVVPSLTEPAPAAPAAAGGAGGLLLLLALGLGLSALARR